MSSARSIALARSLLPLVATLNLLGLSCQNVYTLPPIAASPEKGYQPIEPLPVKIKPEQNPNGVLLDSLPNESMRLAIGQVNASGGISYGPAAIGAKGQNYIVVLDYIKSHTKSIPITVHRTGTGPTTKTEIQAIATECVANASRSFSPNLPVQQSKPFFGSEPPAGEIEGPSKEAALSIPIYLGVGLRMRANVTVLEGEVNLGSLYGLGLAAQQNKIVGTLHIQTLGVSGPTISSILPMPNEINVSTIQNAIQALATIKSKMYDTDRVSIVPAVVGLEDYVGLPGAKEALISILLRECQPTLTVLPVAERLPPK